MLTVIYHEMIRLLGEIANKHISLSNTISSTLSSIKNQAEHIDPFVALAYLDASLRISTDFVVL